MFVRTINAESARKSMKRHRARLVQDPGNAKLHWLLGNCLIGLGEFDEAKAEWVKAVELDPESPSGTLARESLTEFFGI